MLLLFAAAPLPPELVHCVTSEQLQLYNPDSIEPTEIASGGGVTPVWQIRDHHGERIVYSLAYADCHVVALTIDPSPLGAPVVQVITETNTQTTDAEHQMLRRWAGVLGPMPAVCTQRGDGDGDGRFEHVQSFVYDDTTGGLVEVLTDSDGDGRFEARKRYTVDTWGRPSTGECANSYCSKAVTLQCPNDMLCTRNELGLIATMRSNALLLENDYSCWRRGPDRWHYERPTTLPAP